MDHFGDCKPLMRMPSPEIIEYNLDYITWNILNIISAYQIQKSIRPLVYRL